MAGGAQSPPGGGGWSKDGHHPCLCGAHLGVVTSLTRGGACQTAQVLATKSWRSPRGTIRFAVFFSSSLGDGIEMVEALDEAHAADITLAQFPDAQLKVVPASTIEGKNRHRLLFSWLDTL
jgi:hypothetical protein